METLGNKDNDLSVKYGNIFIELEDNNSYKWLHNEKVYMRGNIFFKGKICEIDEITHLFDEAAAQDQDHIADLLREFDGNFNVIYLSRTGEVIACSDRVRSMPLLLWNLSSGGIIIKDELSENLIRKTGIRQDKLSCFRHCLYVDNDYTLFNNVRQIGAGKYALIRSNEIYIYNYYKYEYAKERNTEKEKCVDLIYDSYMEMIDRVLKVLNGRQAVIPLSGGHDSRLMLWLLAELGYDNVITYTYGIKGNGESLVSQNVAKYFGIKSYFVQYKEKPMQKLFKEYVYDYSMKSSSGTGVPCLQEWYAVWWLKDNEIINEDTFIIPGYTGDFLQGCHLSRDAIKKKNWSFEELINHIRVRYYREYDQRYKYMKEYILNAIIEDVLQTSPQKEMYSSDELNEIVERYDLYNRQSKYIVNAVRAYDYWGIKWLTPMFEKNQLDVWGGIDNSLRYNRILQLEFEKKYYSTEFQNIPFYVPYYGNRIQELTRATIKGLSYFHYMYGYYGIKKMKGITDWLNGRLRNVDIYSKDAMLEAFDLGQTTQNRKD